MKKLEILKLQLDAFVQPHIMWKVEVEKNVTTTPIDLLKQGIYEWNLDIEHDAMVASVAEPHKREKLVTDIVDLMLMTVSTNKTDEYHNISDFNYNELCDYANAKIEEALEFEVFHDEVYTYYRDVLLKLQTNINTLVQ